MAKVIVERQRFGSRLPSRKKGYRKYTQSIPLDEAAKREPMLGRWKDRGKRLNEHLAPMRRFLRSNVGRPWNKVHQELCEHVSFTNAVQAHVLAHIDQYVNRHVDIVDGVVVHRTNRWGRSPELRPREMYVCPRTGLLKEVRPARRQRPPTRA